ncbi:MULTISPECIES: tRNA dihydrouridine synthase [Legionella]|uniref:tRNA dihydrouridine synthase n=1 Tax=Legionella TaxID=445 RepID=UPI000F8EED77|nr:MULTISPECIES: tRNA-dihydrouridine synthase [Legionella]MCP0914280.1 tRNA-dihydrouridine synthase [Legionella sp. 27cVA30]RUR11779.1 tRNA-dihydrouridine synthase family protein [Legionella septentrionalis]RUR17467.1 tRNA-dihydrouridine synthase family protein [Legionella septentrionalis]
MSIFIADRTVITHLNLGSLHFPVNIIQGPLAGVSCAPFRLLTWELGQPAFSYTEMISCKTLLHAKAKTRFVYKHEKEGPVCFQLSGSNEKELGEATKIATDYGADLIDLNCGCPVNKIRSRGAGSSLLQKPKELFKLMRAMKASTNVPVSVKIRVDGNSNDHYNREIARIVQDAGIDFITVHGRNWREGYDTPCHYSQIEFFVNELNIPVIGNGDVSCLASLQKMFATGCAGVMIGRAGVGQPWLIAKLIAESKGEQFNLPTPGERGLLFLRHVRALEELLQSEKFAVIQARKFAKYYARNLAGQTEFIKAVNHCENLDELTLVCKRYFNQHA